MRIEPGIVVRMNGNEGVTVRDSFSCCGQEETPVVWNGETYSTGTETKRLEVVGPYKADPDPNKCGAGKGDDCCIFLAVGANGMCCERFSSLRNTLLFKTGMSAKRDPPEPYPDCMNQGQS